MNLCDLLKNLSECKNNNKIPKYYLVNPDFMKKIKQNAISVKRRDLNNIRNIKLIESDNVKSFKPMFDDKYNLSIPYYIIKEK